MKFAECWCTAQRAAFNWSLFQHMCNLCNCWYWNKHKQLKEVS